MLTDNAKKVVTKVTLDLLRDRRPFTTVQVRDIVTSCYDILNICILDIDDFLSELAANDDGISQNFDTLKGVYLVFKPRGELPDDIGDDNH